MVACEQRLFPRDKSYLCGNTIPVWVGLYTNIHPTDSTQQGYHIYVCGLKNESNICKHIDILYFIDPISNPIFFDIFSKMGDQEACAGVYWI